MLLLCVVAVVPFRPAAAQLTASGPYAAAADTSLLKVDVPAISALLAETNVDLARSVALADSDGDVDGEEGGDQRTGGFAATTGTSTLLDTAVDLQSTRASAPPSEDTGEVLLEVPGDPLLGLDVITTRAAANWVSDTECVAATEPLSLADQFAADATVLGIGEGQAIVDVDPGDDGAVDSEAMTSLPEIDGAVGQRAIAASVSTRIAGAELLHGIVAPGESLVSVQVTQAPNYTVQASGLPGGASVTGDDPIVQVSIAGQNAVTLEAGEVEQETLVGLVLGDLLSGLDPLLQPLQPVVRVSIPKTQTVDPNGLTASVDAALLKVELLPPETSGLEGPLAVVELAPMTASVTAPEGGINCGGDQGNPMELQKLNSGPAIPGSTFDYTIAVGNVGDCTLENVSVVDTLTGPAGTEIRSTEPAGATVEPVDGGFRITWADIGSIEPDGRVTLRIRVAVPSGASAGQRYRDVVTATGTCDGQDVTRTFDLPLPEVESTPEGGCEVSGSAKSASHTEVYPGEQFAYFIHAYNSGGQGCTGVTVNDTLVDGVTFVSCSDGCTNNGQAVTWNLGSLAPGQSVTLSVIVEVDADAAGRLPNTATIDTAETPATEVRTDGPLVTDISVLAGNNPASTPGTRALARTGGFGVTSLPIAAGLGALAMALRAARRRA